jgi:periplasmic divalent cation tolerance protein
MKLVYITAPTIEEAKSLGRSLIDQKLAVCVNIIPGMESIYPWKDKIEQAQETILLAKTTEERVERLIAQVHDQHSYEVPCAFSLDVEKVNPAYLEWFSNH